MNTASKISPGATAGIAGGSLGAIVVVSLLVLVYKYVRKNRQKLAAMFRPTPFGEHDTRYH